jgi:hypothetical protein
MVKCLVSVAGEGDGGGYLVGIRQREREIGRCRREEEKVEEYGGRKRQAWRDVRVWEERVRENSREREAWVHTFIQPNEYDKDGELEREKYKERDEDREKNTLRGMRSGER